MRLFKWLAMRQWLLLLCALSASPGMPKARRRAKTTSWTGRCLDAKSGTTKT